MSANNCWLVNRELVLIVAVSPSQTEDMFMKIEFDQDLFERNSEKNIATKILTKEISYSSKLKDSMKTRTEGH